MRLTVRKTLQSRSVRTIALTRRRLRRAAKSPGMDAAKRGERAGGIFVALSYRDYRLLWIGLLVSNVGTWMQYTATGFYVARLAGSPHVAALDLGWLGAARALAVLICSPPAGVAADRIPRRRILFVANLAMALAALAMAVLLSADRLTMT